jgi:hypothetical protein
MLLNKDTPGERQFMLLLPLLLLLLLLLLPLVAAGRSLLQTREW